MTITNLKRAWRAATLIDPLREFFASPDEELLKKILGQGKASALLYALEHGEDLFHDPLTKVYDRRLLEDIWIKEVSRAKRYKHALTMILLDLDGLKEINDSKGYQDKHGYEAGDSALKDLANTIVGKVRKDIDIVIRYGGDEFLIFLPETNSIGARQLMARLVEDLPDDLKVSFGLAEWEGGKLFNELFREANQELHEHKKEKGIERD